MKNAAYFAGMSDPVRNRNFMQGIHWWEEPPPLKRRKLAPAGTGYQPDFFSNNARSHSPSSAAEQARRAAEALFTPRDAA